MGKRLPALYKLMIHMNIYVDKWKALVFRAASLGSIVVQKNIKKHINEELRHIFYVTAIKTDVALKRSNKKEAT